MSLIQEALRRRREESGGSVAPEPPAPGPAATVPAAPTASHPPPLPVQRVAAPHPEPAPEAPVQEDAGESEARRRPALMVVGIVLLVLLLLGGGIGLLSYAFAQWKATKQSAMLAATAAAAQIVTKPALGQPDSAPAASASAGAPATTPPPAPTPVVSGEPATPLTAPPVLTSTLSPEPVAAAPWPNLKLSGVVGKGLRGAATINGRIVTVGEQIEGVEVLSIGDYGAKMEFEGQTRFIKVGSTTE